MVYKTPVHTGKIPSPPSHYSNISVAAPPFRPTHLSRTPFTRRQNFHPYRNQQALHRRSTMGAYRFVENALSSIVYPTSPLSYKIRTRVSPPAISTTHHPVLVKAIAGTTGAPSTMPHVTSLKTYRDALSPPRYMTDHNQIHFPTNSTTVAAIVKVSHTNTSSLTLLPLVKYTKDTHTTTHHHSHANISPHVNNLPSSPSKSPSKIHPIVEIEPPAIAVEIQILFTTSTIPPIILRSNF